MTETREMTEAREMTETRDMAGARAADGGDNFQPKLVSFLCNWCSYAGSDLAGTSRTRHDISARAIRVMCSGRVEPAFVLKAFAQGADGVIIAGCHIPADCHYTNGNFKALARYETFLPLLDELGIERERLALHWISASEGEKYARVMNEFSAQIRKLGPLRIDKSKSCLLTTGPDAGSGERSGAGLSVRYGAGLGMRANEPADECPGKRANERAGECPGERADECPAIRKAQEFAACEAASSGMIDLEARRGFDMPLRVMEPSIIFDPNKCVRCGSCVKSCAAQGIEAIRLDDAQGVVIDEAKCVRCGQCVLSCPLSFPDKTIRHLSEMLDCGLCPYARPVGAVAEKDDTLLVTQAIEAKDKYLVAQFAPSVRATIGEEFGMAPGDQMIGKLYTAFRELGFNKVLDTNFSADLTIMEEGTEFLGRLQNGGVTPMFTSCCPAWVRFAEVNYPRLIPNLSSAKSPQQMLGAAAKTALAKRLGIDPSSMFVVSIMPCTAKKFERARPEMVSASEYWNQTNGGGHGDSPDFEYGGHGGDPDGVVSDGAPDGVVSDRRVDPAYPDVDAVLTTRECGKLLKLYGIDLAAVEESGPDEMLAEYTGAATIFGRTGGVMTAALRTAYEITTGTALEDIELKELGSTLGIKTADIQAGDARLKVAVASGLGNAKEICEDIINGGEFSRYHFIEIMSCPGGCVGGGGQSITSNKIKVAGRAEGLNTEDRGLTSRKSHENASVKLLYDSFFEKPCSRLSHQLLHTHYHLANPE